jgi:methionine biosynthesis protein MetW
MIRCPICGAEGNTPKLLLYDDRYGYPGEFDLFECKNCSHKFLNGEFSEEQIIDLYTNYYPRSSVDLENYRPYREVKGFSAWLDGGESAAYRWVPENVRVLDIGCGFGESLGYFESRGCEAFGVEADENVLRVANKFGFKVHVGIFDGKRYKKDFFDYVTLQQVIEHMANPVAILQQISTVLKPGGKVIISTPNAFGWGAAFFGKRWINWHVPYHLNYFSTASIRLAAEKAGLSLIESKTITNSAWLKFQWAHLLLYPKQGSPSAYWSPKVSRNLYHKALLKSIGLIDLTKINHLITRCFDKYGYGDNYLFQLIKL